MPSHTHGVLHCGHGIPSVTHTSFPWRKHVGQRTPGSVWTRHMLAHAFPGHLFSVPCISPRSSADEDQTYPVHLESSDSARWEDGAVDRSTWLDLVFTNGCIGDIGNETNMEEKATPLFL
ncbi:hypothetical protein VTJ83DRAFT_1720 [Remersonia thermophila]|uniref:Uncharacterized protein n=1 Tax=Remersonia thermophila TaxID=72144 RepID=A0ABR4DGQ8_9PEZI